MNIVWPRSGLHIPSISPRVFEMMAFSLRTWLASMIALYIAFALQLEAPYWAWLTVWIVSQTSPGMVISKGFYRVIGTIFGSILGVVLIALFAQAPELFILALALLVGGCTVTSNLFTNFRAYGTVLTAYTAGIVAADAINTPDQVFFIAMARTSCILIGIASAILVTSIFAPHRSEAATRAKLLAALKDAARRAVFSWQGDNDIRIQIGRQLIFDLIALNTLIEYAAAESGNFRAQANRARGLLAHIFSVISARRSLDAHLIRCGWPTHYALDIFHGVVIAFLNDMPAALDRGDIDSLLARVHELRENLADVQPEQDTLPAEDLASERLIIDRLDDLLEHLGGALEAWRDILAGSRDLEPRLSLNFHRDIRAAWINGLRAFLAVVATGAFWIASAWDHGPSALVFVAVLLSVFSSQPHPDQIGWAFFKSGLLAVVFALVCKYLILSAGSGFEFLTFGLALFLIPLGFVMANPTMTVPAAGFTFVFMGLVAPTNPMVYDLAETLNTGLATLVGVLFGTLAYILILPPDPAAARRYVTYRIRSGLGNLARRQLVLPTSSPWETRMYDRVIRLNDPQNLSATPTDEWLDAGLGALTLGNEILRLRRWLAHENLSSDLRAAITKIIAAFSDFLSHPQRAVSEVKNHLPQILELDPGPGHPQRRSWARIVGALEEIDVSLDHHPRLTKALEAT